MEKKITASLLVDLAKRRLLSPVFEKGYEKGRRTNRNPVVQALRDADTKVQLRESQYCATFGLVCSAGLLALGIILYHMPKDDPPLPLSMLAVMVVLGILMIWYVSRGLPYLRSRFSIKLEYDIVSKLCSDLDIFYHWAADLRVNGLDPVEFLQFCGPAIRNCAEEVVVDVACNVVRYQRKNLPRTAQVCRHEASLRADMEERYDHLRECFGFVEPGGVGLFYDRAEKIVDAEEEQARRQKAIAAGLVRPEPIESPTGATVASEMVEPM